MASTLDYEKLRPGDLIEIFRGYYQHWVVYVGDGYVVHLAPPSEGSNSGYSSMMSVVADRALIKREMLCKVVGTDKWQVNNGLDDKYMPLSPSVIVRTAEEQVGRQVPYCLMSGNCEHFANDLRYGKSESRQVTDARNVAIGFGAAAGVVVAGFALHSMFRNSGGNKNKTQLPIMSADQSDTM